MEKYRFDDAYSLVSVYDDEAECYLHIGSYLGCGINSAMDNATKVVLLEEILYSE